MITPLEKPPRYKTFLLTIWEERSFKQRQRITWRFGLEDPQTGERRAYSGLEALTETLRQMIGAAEVNDEESSRMTVTLPTLGHAGLSDQSSPSSEDEESQNS
jgi:hypothetical protein